MGETTSSRLTIVLPLKGRHLHTLRFLWHADRQRLPYRFLIADGEVHPIIDNLLGNPASTFPNLDIEYIRYPDDVNYGSYYRKLADVAARVRTPYVMQVDNDDFLVMSGVDRCVAFLDENRDFVGYSGGVGGFSLWPALGGKLAGVTGQIKDVIFPYGPHYLSRDFSSPTVAERIRCDFRGTFALYYCIYRADSFNTISHEIAELNMSDLQLYETYLGMRAKSLGKNRLDASTISYMRQIGTSMNAAKYQKWIYHLLHSQFSSDFEAMVTRISNVVASVDDIDAISYAEEVRLLYVDKLDEQLRHQLADPPPSIRRRIKNLLHTLSLDSLLESYRGAIIRKRTSHTGHRVAMRRADKQIADSLRTFGAPKVVSILFQKELDSIREVLEGPGFPNFVNRHAPGLLVE